MTESSSIPSTSKTVVPKRTRSGAGIASVRMSVPDNTVSNLEVARMTGVEPEWIVKRTGIEGRRAAGPDEDIMQFAAEASEGAIADAGLEPDDVDLVLFATMTYPEIMPAAAPTLADRLGIAATGAMDINAACNGFIAGLDVASSQVESGRSENALVVGADFMRDIIDETDRTTATVFGDGAGASIVTAVSGDTRIAPFARGADGSMGHVITASHAERRVEMVGYATFDAAVERLSEATLGAVETAGLTLDDIDHFVYHQANRRILTAVGERIGLGDKHVVDCIEHYGNSSAATVPIALASAQDAGELSEGDRVLIGAFGGGLMWGAAVVEWGAGT